MFRTTTIIHMDNSLAIGRSLRCEKAALRVISFVVIINSLADQRSSQDGLEVHRPRPAGGGQKVPIFTYITNCISQ